MAESEAGSILQGFRLHYQQFQEAVHIANAHDNPDVFVFQMLGDDLQTFSEIAAENEHVFLDPNEYRQLQENLQLMILDIRVMRERAEEATHHGAPPLIQYVSTGGRGRPSIQINPAFLAWAYTERSESGIAHFLGISRSTVRRLLLDYGIAQPGEDPFDREGHEEADVEHNEDDSLPEAQVDGSEEFDFLALPEVDPEPEGPQPSSRLSNMSDNDLDNTLLGLRVHYPRAGIKTLQGMLRSMGHRVPYHRIRHALLRIDPVHRVFERIIIRRRRYRVPGPNYLWHHDGHHSLIRWGIIIHAFIDGYSRVITGIRASNNNTAATVLLLFLVAAHLYGVPSRLRGDHGGENVWVAALMEHIHGRGRGSYIWGRSVHNVRIERLWVDVRAQITATWEERFTELELQLGMDINNQNHVWLLQLLFIPIMNEDMEFWRESWNNHDISVRNGSGPSRSPNNMFGFDMFTSGFRGTSLQNHPLSEEELEVFGIDWEGLHDDVLLKSLRGNYSSDGVTSWIGQRGPPPELSEVVVEPPPCSLSEEEVCSLLIHVSGLPKTPHKEDVHRLWIAALVYARQLRSDLF
ncbi:hypothetical protein AAF712_007836 [Marasmius tenuissimus]|uniref:Integrase catalytic domain-containing protein n=1 Tax=Marasmius tenuissimus TaxID=585030 RepID=A0ABR2ZU00_9AGAR|nr:hypothetical protein PM082_000960 [Marasmius tenuissimus]